MEFKLSLKKPKSYEANFFMIMSTKFDSLARFVSLFEVRSSLYFNIFGLA